MSTANPNGKTGLHIPKSAIVEVAAAPCADMLPQGPERLLPLLQLALAGVETGLPATLSQVLQVTESVVGCERLLIVFEETSGANRSQVTRQFAVDAAPGLERNRLHAWTRAAARPIVVSRGMRSEMDSFLDEVQARAAAAVPLAMGAEWTGTLQLFRSNLDGFSLAEVRTLWLLSLLAGAQMSRVLALLQLTKLAYTDFLTGVRARGYFEQALEQEVHRATRHHNSLGLVLVDLDDFKLINDRFGHHGGDEILRQFARVLQHDMRDVDTVARFGGDEFALILPDAGDDGVRRVVNRLHAVVGQAEFTLPGYDQRLRLGLSVGVALCPADAREPGALVRAADAALYEAKQRGKGRPLFTREIRRAG